MLIKRKIGAMKLDPEDAVFNDRNKNKTNRRAKLVEAIIAHTDPTLAEIGGDTMEAMIEQSLIQAGVDPNASVEELETEANRLGIEV